MTRWWQGLADDELYARLIGRGVGATAARALVDHREDELAVVEIARVLDR